MMPSVAQVEASNWASPVSFARMTFVAKLSMEVRTAAVSRRAISVEGNRSDGWHPATRPATAMSQRRERMWRNARC